MRPIYLDIDPADANLTGYLSNATGAGPFTMTTTNSGDNLAHQVSIRNDSATDLSGSTFTLTGTDADGRAITEAVAGPTASATVESAKYFLTFTSATVDVSLAADTVDFGWVDEFATQTIPLEAYSTSPAVVQVVVTGTINYDVEETYDNVFSTLAPDGSTWDEQADFTWVNSGNFAGATTTLDAELTNRGVRAMRVVVNSYTNTAELKVSIISPY